MTETDDLTPEEMAGNARDAAFQSLLDDAADEAEANRLLLQVAAEIIADNIEHGNDYIANPVDAINDLLRHIGYQMTRIESGGN